MSFLGTIAAGLERQPQRQASPPADTAMSLAAFLGARNLQAGENVSVERAMGLVDVWACLRILGDTIGTTPLHVYREVQGDEGREKDRNSDAWYLLNESPNPEQTAADIWTTVGLHLNGWGDAFLGKQFENGVLVALWAMDPSRIEIKRVKGVKLFVYRDPGGKERTYTAADVIHIMGPSTSGLRGLSPIGMAREAVSAGLALEAYLHRFYKNSALPRGALTSPNELTGDAATRIRDDWERLHRGVENAHRVAVLEQGLEFKQLTMPFGDMQFVEQQQLGTAKIARIFRVPLSLLASDAAKSSMTYRTVQDDNRQFLTHSVRPWFERIQQSLARDRDLFPRPMGRRPRRFPEFFPAALLSVDPKTEAEVFAIATGGAPWMRSSEVRRAKNMERDDTIDELQPKKAAPTEPAKPEKSDEDEKQRAPVVVVTPNGEVPFQLTLPGFDVLLTAVKEIAERGPGETHVTVKNEPAQVVVKERERRVERHTLEFDDDGRVIGSRVEPID